ncbi:MAG TPA: hypothetical protein VFZ04_21805 [Longimicrobiales bacterium]
MMVAAVAAILIVAFLFFRRSGGEPSGEQPRILGTRDTVQVEIRDSAER